MTNSNNIREVEKMKKLLVSVMGLLLIGVNAFAAGDLIVNGKLGVGVTSVGTESLHVVGGQTKLEMTDGMPLWSYTLRSDITGGVTKTSNTFTTTISDPDWTGFAIEAFNASSNYTGRSSGLSRILAFQNATVFNSAVAGTHSIDQVYNSYFKLAIGGANTQNISIAEYAGFKHSYESAGLGSLTGTNWYGAFFTNPPSANFAPTNLHGLWVDKQTRGTNNFGIVLAGDGSGADIVFGYRKLDKMPAVLKFGNWFIRLITRALYNIDLKDTQSGYRAFTAEAYKKIKWNSCDYSMESEMVTKAGKHHLKYKQIPIQTIYSDRYKGTTIIDGIKIVLNLIWWRLTK